MHKLNISIISFLSILLLDFLYIRFLSQNMFNIMIKTIQGSVIKPKYLAIFITYIFIFMSYFYLSYIKFHY